VKIPEGEKRTGKGTQGLAMIDRRAKVGKRPDRAFTKNKEEEKKKYILGILSSQTRFTATRRPDTAHGKGEGTQGA